MLVVGIAVGAILVILIAAIIIWYILHIKKRNRTLPVDVVVLPTVDDVAQGVGPKAGTRAGSPRDAVDLDEGSND